MPSCEFFLRTVASWRGGMENRLTQSRKDAKIAKTESPAYSVINKKGAGFSFHTKARRHEGTKERQVFSWLPGFLIHPPLCAFAFLLFTLLFSGCVILPLPHRRLHAYGVEGRVLDAASRKPIQCASVQAKSNSCPASFTTCAKTDAEGRFSIASKSGWHYGILLCPVDHFSLFPLFHQTFPRSKLSVSAPGYSEQKLSTLPAAGDILLKKDAR